MATLKKKYFEVEVPIANLKTEVYAYSLESIANKTIKFDLTRILRGKSLELQTKIKLEDGKAIAEPVSLTLLGFFIRRMLRKGVDYVEDSFLVNAKDVKFQVKPFLITRKKVSRKVKNALRIACKDFLTNYIKERTKDEVFTDIVANHLQKNMSIKLKKIYPLALCEVRALKITK